MHSCEKLGKKRALISWSPYITNFLKKINVIMMTEKKYSLHNNVGVYSSLEFFVRENFEKWQQA